ncbi:MAG: phenylalanyl-tRNA synthetase beta chain [Actinomycetota bacterium]|nr:phenylalanyl-tRNA synthetase beta chain [Actinomycetota bacterium]
MRVGLRWLREYVDIDVPVDRLVERLDLSGTKVEAVHKSDHPVEGVIAAKVLAIKEHPDADNLTLVDIDAGAGSTERVVCGARNFVVGDVVPYAGVGAHLPEMEITERKIRGQVSRGMLCSAAELGISKDHSGILVLGHDIELGSDVARMLELDDTILELEITLNRPDCLGMFGVAREVSAVLGTELRIPEVTPPASDAASPLQVDIEDAQGCPRYLGRYIERIGTGPSPQKMQARLLAAGMRPVSNVVDVTNYVLLETGHPLHAFDAAMLKKTQIVVRRARRGERITTLDGIERHLDPEDVVIADAKDPVAIAGIMGGAGSEVSEGSSAVVLESAYFDSGAVGRTSRRLQLRTEASTRFERGADVEMVPYAAARAASLIESAAGGRVIGPAIDRYPNEIPRRRVTLSPRTSDRLLGMKTPPDRQAAYLKSVGFGVAANADVLDVEVPSFRPDVTREVDLIEEVARLAGFERLPATLPPGVAGGLNRTQSIERTLRRYLVSQGSTECWTPSFAAATDFDLLGLDADHPSRAAVAVANPMSEEESILRTTLMPGLLRVAARNVSFRASSVAIFELARVYEARVDAPAELPHEPMTLGGAFCGPKSPQTWMHGEVTWDFFAVKGVVTGLCSALGITGFQAAGASGLPFHPTRAASLKLNSRTIGAMGQLHPDVCARFDVPDGTVCFEMAFAPLLGAIPSSIAVHEVSRLPATYIDIAVVVDEKVTAQQLVDQIVGSGRPEVVNVRLFDLYRGDQVGAGRKSLAFALELRAADRTLTDEEALVVRDRIMSVLSQQFDARLRG